MQTPQTPGRWVQDSRRSMEPNFLTRLKHRHRVEYRGRSWSPRHRRAHVAGRWKLLFLLCSYRSRISVTSAELCGRAVPIGGGQSDVLGESLKLAGLSFITPRAESRERIVPRWR